MYAGSTSVCAPQQRPSERADVVRNNLDVSELVQPVVQFEHCFQLLDRSHSAQEQVELVASARHPYLRVSNRVAVNQQLDQRQRQFYWQFGGTGCHAHVFDQQCVLRVVCDQWHFSVGD